MQTCSDYHTRNYRNNAFCYFYTIHDFFENEWYENLPLRVHNFRKFNRVLRSVSIKSFRNFILESFLSIRSQALPSCDTAFFVTINIGSSLSLVSFINSQVLHLLYVQTLVPTAIFTTAITIIVKKCFPNIIFINFYGFFDFIFAFLFDTTFDIST